MSDPDRHDILLQPSGWRFAAEPQQTLLRAARLAGIRLPSSCRNGTCRACICRMPQGEVTYAVERPGLSADEKAEGYVLPCVARAAAPLVLEAAGASRLDAEPEARALPLTGARR